MQDFDFEAIRYKCRPISTPKSTRYVTALGFDTEADREGNTFMYCFSDGTVCSPHTLLDTLFSRQYRGSQFVVYNLKYEQGAILQLFPRELIDGLRVTGDFRTTMYHVTTIGYKCLRIARGKNAVTFWDMHSFFNMSLANAARQFTNTRKIEQDVTLFEPEYIAENWDKIARYCIKDAQITAKLFDVLLSMCDRMGIHPTTFYSCASIAYKYVREQVGWVTVERFWKDHRDVLRAACEAYAGGKFEVTTRGKGTFYEYDINSAYPYDISNLIDISDAVVVESHTRPPYGVYGFLKCRLFFGDNVAHTIPLKRKGVNVYPIGRFTKWLTAEEYDYTITLPGVEVKILRGIWLVVRHKKYLFRNVIHELYKTKLEAKVRKDKELYHFSKTMMNALYGKFVQLIKKGDHLEASTCWNPIYGAIITANVRIRIARLQNEYQGVVAVHTDSVLCTHSLPIQKSQALGDWDETISGVGIVLGSGVYQVGDKVRLRGFPAKVSLMHLLARSPPVLTIPDKRAYSWREVVFHHWSTDLINRFTELDKHLNVNFDTKRLWDDEWVDGNDCLDRVIESLPRVVF